MIVRSLGVVSLIGMATHALAEPDPAAVRRALAMSEEVYALSGLNEADALEADGPGGKADSSITGTSTNKQGQTVYQRQGGGESASSQWNRSAARKRIADRNRRISELQAAMLALPPDVLQAAAEARAHGTSPSSSTGGSQCTFIGVCASAPSKGFLDSLGDMNGTMTFDLSGRILGGGDMDDSDGITGNGFAVSTSLASILGNGRPGIYFGGEVELGGFKDHGKIGSIGVDLGLGLRGRATMLAASVGAHYASLYQNASVFPLLGHLAVFGDRWGLFVDAGIAWRKDLVGSTTQLDGPMGTHASVFRLTLRRNHVHLGFGVQAMDGDTIGSVYLGGGTMMVDPLR